MTRRTTAIDRGYKAARRVAGLSITYARPSSGYSVELTVLPGQTPHTVEQGGQVIDEFKSQDFVILAEELILNGSTVLPTRGDTITLGSTVYELLAISGQTHWEYADEQKLTLRVHTKQR